MGKHQSSKVFDGFSTVFRQWKAENTHCRFLHGYGISFKVYFFAGLLFHQALKLEPVFFIKTCQFSKNTIMEYLTS